MKTVSCFEKRFKKPENKPEGNLREIYEKLKRNLKEL